MFHVQVYAQLYIHHAVHSSSPIIPLVIISLNVIIPLHITQPHPSPHHQGMDFTTDKLRSLVKKWQTLIEAAVDIKTTDGYFLRVFCIAFTKKRAKQVKKTCYAQSSQIRQIRKKMFEIITKESTSCDLKDLVGKFIPESIGMFFLGGG